MYYYLDKAAETNRLVSELVRNLCRIARTMYAAGKTGQNDALRAGGRVQDGEHGFDV